MPEKNSLNPSIREAPSNVTPGAPSDQDVITPGEEAQVRLIGDERAGLRVNGETVVSPDSNIAFGPEKNTLFIPERFTSEPGTLDVEVVTDDGRTAERQVDVTPRDQLDEREQAANEGGQQNFSAGEANAGFASEGDADVVTGQAELEPAGISPEQLASGDEPSTLVGEDFRGNDTGGVARLERPTRADQLAEQESALSQAERERNRDQRDAAAGAEPVDGRKSRVEGGFAAVNPRDEARAVVLDQAGDEGARVFPGRDDPLAPDTPEAAGEIGEAGTSDRALNRRGETARVAGLPTVNAPDLSLDDGGADSVDAGGGGGAAQSSQETDLTGDSEREEAGFGVVSERRGAVSDPPSGRST